MIIPVIRKGDEEQGIIWLNIDEVTHLLRTRKEIEFHTVDSVYILPNALEYWKDPLQKEGFERLDWSILANMNKILEFDEEQQNIYFKRESKGIIIAKTHFTKVRNFLSGKKKEEE